MGVKDKKGSVISPILFKFGVALAASVGGVVYTFFQKQKNYSLQIKSLSAASCKGKADSGGERGEFGDVDRSLQNSIDDLSSTGRHVVDRDGFLDQLIKEYDMATNDVESPTKYKYAVHEECNREISSLLNKIEILEERERALENQLLEYYGLKEQETAVTELQNRLRLHNVEAKLYNLKIGSLQLDKNRLQAKVADYEKVVTELESARAKVKQLRKKLRFEAEQNREQILNLHERVIKFKNVFFRDINDTLVFNVDIFIK